MGDINYFWNSQSPHSGRPRFIALPRYWVSINWRFVATLHQAYWCHFSNSICSLHVSVSHFGNSHNISKFSLLLYMLWWSVISDLFFLVFKNLLFIYYLFLAVLGLRFCARAFSSFGKREPLFIAMRGPLTITASLVAEHRLQMHRLSSCGSRAQLLRGMGDLPRPGPEPVSPALAGRLSTTAPPGKPCDQWSLTWPLQKDYDLLKTQSIASIFFSKKRF